MADERIADDEIVYRRIPPTEAFFEEPDRVTSANFKLDRRRSELGLSVYRAIITSPADVLGRPEAIPDSKITGACVRDIRQLQSGSGTWLQLDVIVVDDAGNPGHAEIRGPQPGRLSDGASKALRDLFKFA